MYNSPRSPRSVSGSTIQSPSISTPSTSSVDEDNDPLALDNQTEVTEAFKRASKRHLPFCGEAQFKKACRNVYNLDLREFLENSVPGKFILHTYKKEKRLNRKTRNLLTTLVINGLISQEG